MIERINYYRLNNTELFTLIKSLLSIFTGLDTAALGLKVWHDKLEHALKNLEDAIGFEIGSSLTIKVVEADDLRDRCFKAFRTYIEACRLRNNTEWVAAADMIIRIMNKYGLNLHNESYTKESALLDNLILELKNDPKAVIALKLILAEVWFQELLASQEAFIAIWQMRREEQALKGSSKGELARKEIHTHSINLSRYIELMYSSGQEEPYLSIINNMNEEIIKANTIAKSRYTRNHNEVEVKTDL
jgi:hypothetical protein